MTIVLPLPHKLLSPNKRSHWAAKARVVKKTRRDAEYAAISEMNDQEGPFRKFKAAKVTLRFYRRTRHVTDPDNLIASIKPVLDGFTDAGLWRDDNNLIISQPETFVDKTDPRLEVEINETDERELT